MYGYYTTCYGCKKIYVYKHMIIYDYYAYFCITSCKAVCIMFYIYS